MSITKGLLTITSQISLIELNSRMDKKEAKSMAKEWSSGEINKEKVIEFLKTHLKPVVEESLEELKVSQITWDNSQESDDTVDKAALILTALIPKSKLQIETVVNYKSDSKANGVEITANYKVRAIYE